MKTTRKPKRSEGGNVDKRTKRTEPNYEKSFPINENECVTVHRLTNRNAFSSPFVFRFILSASSRRFGKVTTNLGLCFMAFNISAKFIWLAFYAIV